MGNSTITVTDKSFTEEVLQADKPVLVDFWATWCGPCKIVAPILEELADELSDKLTVAKVDVDQNPETAGHYQIMSIPTLVLFQGGKPTKTIVGSKAKATLLKEIESAL